MAIPKKFRISDKEEIKTILFGGRFLKGDLFFARILPGKVQNSRFTVIIPKKAVPTAAKRNELKRYMTEHLYKKISIQSSEWKDVIFFVAPAILKKSKEEIKGALEDSIKKIFV